MMSVCTVVWSRTQTVRFRSHLFWLYLAGHESFVSASPGHQVPCIVGWCEITLFAELQFAAVRGS